MLERPRATSDITHTTLSVLFLVLLLMGSYLVLRPFLTAFLWATIVSVAVWPALLRLEAALGRRRKLAVAIVTAVILLAVFIPVTLALITIVRHAQRITGDIGSFQTLPVPSPPSWVATVPIVGGRLADEWRRFAALAPADRTAVLGPYVQRALQWFAATAGSIGAMLLQLLLTAIISGLVLANGETVRDGILRFARRLAGQQGQAAAELAARAIRGVVLGVVGTALIQTAIGGAGLLIAGIPAAGLLAAVMLFMCLAQLGPIPLLVPVVAWLYWSGQSGAGTTLLVFSIVAGTIDNVLRPMLIRRGANLPLVIIFAGVIGGLLAFGIVGLFIGPVVLGVTYTLLASWTQSAESEEVPA
ncbi:MAG TPA: AI-2E family transporter YdiK [Vicinamibacterales bacterium]|jgi:predicted PurR-regulated permease PerM